jgi:uncharacterized membrane protein
MKTNGTKFVGWLLILLGVLIAIFSERIVFPGLERLVGIETIVGKSNVIYQPGGSYIFTNPGAMIRWISAVAFVGLLVCLSGALLLWRSRRGVQKISDDSVQKGGKSY